MGDLLPSPGEGLSGRKESLSSKIPTMGGILNRSPLLLYLEKGEGVLGGNVSFRLSQIRGQTMLKMSGMGCRSPEREGSLGQEE